jgi:hypothetical protein
MKAALAARQLRNSAENSIDASAQRPAALALSSTKLASLSRVPGA